MEMEKRERQLLRFCKYVHFPSSPALPTQKKTVPGRYPSVLQPPIFQTSVNTGTMEDVHFICGKPAGLLEQSSIM